MDGFGRIVKRNGPGTVRYGTVKEQNDSTFGTVPLGRLMTIVKERSSNSSKQSSKMVCFRLMTIRFMLQLFNDRSMAVLFTGTV